MHRIRMTTLSAGPAGVFHPGETRVVGADEYAVLVPDFAEDAAEVVADTAVTEGAAEVVADTAVTEGAAEVAAKPLSAKGKK